MMSPAEAIRADPPNVWLTAFYGFTPERWGFLGFSSTGQRNHFVRETQPGALVVIYGHKARASETQRGQVIGIQQVSHRVNNAQAFMDPVEWARKDADGESRDKWNLAVKATRAWRVAPESYMPIDAFADESYSVSRAQHIGAQGVRLTAREATKLLDLTLVETSVFGEIAVDAASPAEGHQVLVPSKAGPVSQTAHYTREAEGPKQLYVLRLEGDTGAFLGRPADGAIIVKVGLSRSPQSRRDALNAALPAGAYLWTVLRSNDLDGAPLYPTSRPALAGEAAMKDALARSGSSLGGEFFLATEAAIAAAWEAGRRAARRYPYA